MEGMARKRTESPPPVLGRAPVPDEQRAPAPGASASPAFSPVAHRSGGVLRHHWVRHKWLLLGVAALVLGLSATVGLFAAGQRELKRSVAVETFGAVGDGRTDDGPAIQRALDSLSPGETLRFTDGRTYLHAALLRASVRGTTLSGAATLMAANEARSAFQIDADDVTVEQLTFTTPTTTQRWDAYEQQKIWISGHSGVVLRDVTVRGSAAAGVYVGGGASHFLLERVRIDGTRADGIHITQGSHDGVIRRPVTTRTGDDGVAVVSYRQDGRPCARIRVEEPTVLGTTGGRGVSVVGGVDVLITDVNIQRSAAAAIYVSAEGDPYFTAGVRDVQIRGGRILDANQDASIDHGAVLIYDGSDSETVEQVSIVDLNISGTRSTASRQVGVIAGRARLIKGVKITDIALTGGPAQLFSIEQPDQGFALSRWTQDGVKIPDRNS